MTRSPRIPVAIVFALILSSFTQEKRPKIQEKSLWIENVKVDGNLSEWPDPLEAFNPETSIEYNLANDDEYLYLAVKSDRTQKIFHGGVTLEIERNDQANLSITYPYNFTYDLIKDPTALYMHPKRPMGFQDFVEIESYGLEGEEMKLIPMVNEFGVQAAISDSESVPQKEYNPNRRYFLEFAIPLAHLTSIDLQEIKYNIKLRGILVEVVPGLDRMSDYKNLSNPQEINKAQLKEQDKYIPKEFKGVYKLATAK